VGIQVKKKNKYLSKSKNFCSGILLHKDCDKLAAYSSMTKKHAKRSPFLGRLGKVYLMYTYKLIIILYKRVIPHA